MFAFFETDRTPGFPKTSFERLITALVDLTGCRTYLELGVSEGGTFNSVVPLVREAIGVDVVDGRLQKVGGRFYEMTTDRFFEENPDVRADIIFIDADHSFSQVVKDFENCLSRLNEYGIVILDDTDPMREQYVSNTRCGDAYRVIDYIKEHHKELDVVSLPILLKGMSIVTRSADRRVNRFLVPSSSK